MDTKSAMFGVGGILIGGIIVGVGMTTLNTQTSPPQQSMPSHGSAMVLEGKTGDEYDKAFLSMMIDHHEGALEAARYSADRAAHTEIKQLSNEITSSQQREIEKMKQWQVDWGYKPAESSHHY